MVPVVVYLTPEQIEWARRKARKQKRQMAGIYREAIDYARGVVDVLVGGNPRPVVRVERSDR